MNVHHLIYLWLTWGSSWFPFCLDHRVKFCWNWPWILIKLVVMISVMILVSVMVFHHRRRRPPTRWMTMDDDLNQLWTHFMVARMFSSFEIPLTLMPSPFAPRFHYWARFVWALCSLFNLPSYGCYTSLALKQLADGPWIGLCAFFVHYSFVFQTAPLLWLHLYTCIFIIDLWFLFDSF